MTVNVDQGQEFSAVAGPEAQTGPPDLGLDQQIRLPFLSIVFMTVGNVRNRLGRSMITLFGVVLGTAFLMAVGTSDKLRITFAEQEVDRGAAADAAANAAVELGTLEGRTLAVIVERWDGMTLRFLEKLDEQDQTRLQIFAPGGNLPSQVGVAVATAAEVVAGASALIICNRGALQASELPPGTAGLAEKIVMDLQGLYDPETMAQKGLHYRNLQDAGQESIFLGKRRQTDQKETARTTWLVVISLLVGGIGIANALLMSVTERFREIGTLKCLGSPDRLVVQLFIIESGVLGLLGAAIGVVVGFLIAVTGNAATYGWSLVWTNLPWTDLLGFGIVSLFVGLLVAMIAAVYPATVAARMVPADALRSEV